MKKVLDVKEVDMKHNLLQEFKNEYELRAFLENNDENILYIILRYVEPKFEPIKDDIEKALRDIELKDPIQALENVDLDDDDALSKVFATELTIEDVVKNREKELDVISKIEHMLTPEDREYLMDKFLNDKVRDWMYNREASKNN